MARYCADCTYFNPKDKKGGKSGLCKCSKSKKYMLANTERCKNFERAYARNWYEAEKLYDDAKELEKNSAWDDKEVPLAFPVILIIILIILKILNVA